MLVLVGFDWNQKLPCEWCRSMFGFSALSTFLKKSSNSEKSDSDI